MGDRAIIVDMDGTLALNQSGRGYFEWGRVGEDSLNVPVAEIVRRFAPDHAVIIVTGRSRECERETTDWLDKYGIPYDNIFMREPGDYRKDAVIKAEIFEQYLSHWRIAFCLDDRNQSVEFWRERDLVCLQVARGDY